MSAQTTYNFFGAKGAAGGIVDLAPYEINTMMNDENDGVLFTGCAVFTEDGVLGISADSASDSSLGAESFAGILVNNRTREMEQNGKHIIKHGAAIGVMRFGKCYAVVDENADPEYGDSVYVTTDGTVTESSSSTTLINARFLGSADNGVAPIEIMKYNALDKT